MVGGTSSSTGADASAVYARLEQVAIFVASLFFYRTQLGGWGRFVVLLLLPELSRLADAAGPAVGGRVYNLAHSYVGPVFLAAYSVYVGRSDMVMPALAWMANISLNRALGVGLRR